MSGWIAIFRTGTHTDGAGQTREWTRGDLDQLVANYNPTEHEAPVVIGHPQTDDPAWAWVEALRRTGDILYAKLKDVVPEFGEMVRKGLFKKRSIALFLSSDGRWSLRHIGFLGATPPAVKGLEDRLAFTEGDCPTPTGLHVLEFAAMDDQERSLLGRMLTSLREWIIDRSGLEEADRVLPSWEIQALTTPQPHEAPVMAGPSAQETDMTPEELARRLAEAREEGRRTAETTFAEHSRAQESRLVQLEADSRQHRLQTVLDDLKRQGKVLPAWERAGLLAFMECLAALPSPPLTLTFAAQTGLSPAVWFEVFLQAMPARIAFGEAAPVEDDLGGDLPGVQLVELTYQYMQTHPDLSYAEAFGAVQQAHPALAQEYLATMRHAARER